MRYRRFVKVCENFYPDLKIVRDHASGARFHEPEDATGLRSTTIHHPPGVRRRLERILGLRITRWDTDPADENGVFYIALARGRSRETPGVHFDHPASDVTAVIYLSPGLPADCGTSLWMHRATGLTAEPTAADARRLGKPLAELRAILERDSRRRERWIEIDRIDYRPNRLVAYPSGVLHSATRHYGGSLATGRLYQTFRIGVDWNRFAG